MLQFEQECWIGGMRYVAGVDEVGRGCLFGDVVAAAVILPVELVLEGVNDSKKISEKKRQQLFTLIHQHALAVSVAAVDAQTIDTINIRQASRLAMKRAVDSLTIRPDWLLIDAESVDCEIPQQSIIKGDERSQSIAAASIIAKVTRDQWCQEWHRLYPQYGLDKHKGYATATHSRAILDYGPSPLHRKTFMRKLLGETV